MPIRHPRVKKHPGKRPRKLPRSIKIVALLIHLMGLLILFVQRPEVHEILQLLLKWKL